MITRQAQQGFIHAADAAHAGGELARTNYSFEKRQRELAKKKKQEEKRQRKGTRAEPAEGEPPAADSAAAGTPTPERGTEQP
jgi:hypothetical protein